LCHHTKACQQSMQKRRVEQCPDHWPASKSAYCHMTHHRGPTSCVRAAGVCHDVHGCCAIMVVSRLTWKPPPPPAPPPPATLPNCQLPPAPPILAVLPTPPRATPKSAVAVLIELSPPLPPFPRPPSPTTTVKVAPAVIAMLLAHTRAPPPPPPAPGIWLSPAEGMYVPAPPPPPMQTKLRLVAPLGGVHW
jgi:hypothetical protein